MVPANLKPLTSPKTTAKTVAAAVDFLTTLWSGYHETAYTFLSTRDGRWINHAIRGDRASQIVEFLQKFPPELFDIYFCPNAFDARRLLEDHALPTRYAWCDIDNADPRGYDPAPNILWQTSPGRFQAIWIWDKKQPGQLAAASSRGIVYKDGGDKGGWAVTKLLRLPGTINHKPQYQKPVVTLHRFDAQPQKLPASNEPFQVRDVTTRSSGIDISGLARKIHWGLADVA
jgi:hypothetical protein